MTNNEASTYCTFPWEMYSVDSGFGWWRPCPRIDYQPLKNKDFFNHESLIGLRRNLRAGLRDPLCNKCWNDEDQGVKSYRQVLGQDRKPNNFLQDYIPVPSILELKFSNLCNLKCVFCANRCSSLWEKEFPIPPSDYGDIHGPELGRELLDYFKKNYSEIKTIQIFGGEPVLHPEFNEIVTILCEAPASDAKKILSFSTNMFFSSSKMEDFLIQIQAVLRAGHKLYLRMSIDGVEDQGEYLRTGLKWKVFHNNLMNLKRTLGGFKDFGRVKCNIALNILNLTSLNIIMKYLKDNDLEWVEPHYNYVGKPEKFMLQSYGRRLKEALSIVSQQDFYGYDRYKAHVLSLVGSMTSLEPNLEVIKECRDWLDVYDKNNAVCFSKVFPNNEYMFRRV